jgi:hypothetical protein
VWLHTNDELTLPKAPYKLHEAKPRNYALRVRSRAPLGDWGNPSILKNLRRSSQLLCMLGGYCQVPILGYPEKKS